MLYKFKFVKIKYPPLIEKSKVVYCPFNSRPTTIEKSIAIIYRQDYDQIDSIFDDRFELIINLPIGSYIYWDVEFQKWKPF